MASVQDLQTESILDTFLMLFFGCNAMKQIQYCLNVSTKPVVVHQLTNKESW